MSRAEGRGSRLSSGTARRDLIQPFRRALAALEPPGGTLLVACSGGPDSTALLDLAVRAAPARQLTLIVVHLDHGWREDSSRDAQLVADAAARRGLPVVLGRADPVPRGEASARDARLRLFARAALEHAARGVLLGHSADDQAETVLLHALRGVGLDGLAGMRPETTLEVAGRPLRLLRPLLGIRRRLLHDYCAARGLAVALDETNDDQRYARNRVRSDLLPAAERAVAGATDALVRLAEIAAEERAVVAEAAERALPSILDRANGALVRGPFRALPVGVQRAVLRRASGLLLSGIDEPGFERIEAARRLLLRGRGGGVVEWPGPARLRVLADRVIFERSA